MERAMPFDKDSSVQYRVEEYPLGNPVDILGNDPAGEPKPRILRLVMTPAEGYELLRRLRSDPQASGIPVIVLTH